MAELQDASGKAANTFQSNVATLLIFSIPFIAFYVPLKFFGFAALWMLSLLVGLRMSANRCRNGLIAYSIIHSFFALAAFACVLRFSYLLVPSIHVYGYWVRLCYMLVLYALHIRSISWALLLAKFLGQMPQTYDLELQDVEAQDGHEYTEVPQQEEKQQAAPAPVFIAAPQYFHQASPYMYPGQAAMHVPQIIPVFIDAQGNPIFPTQTSQ